MTLWVVRVLGWLVVAHGLSHAVLPLRGSTAPALLIGDWVPVGLYVIAMIGFVVAGLGLLGLRPYEAAISPVLVLSSGLSLVAISRFGDPTLWAGGVVDVGLLLMGLWRGYGGWPTHPHHRRAWHVLALVSGFAFVGYVALATALFPWHRTWGSTRDELALSLPGDNPDRVPAFELQHAITIDAPPDAVWPWLAQLDQDRATQPDYLAGTLGRDLGWRIRELQANRVMVLDHWGAFVLLPAPEGRTRFIIRSQLSDARVPVWAAGLQFMAFELPHFIMERRMMLGIKSRADESVNRQAVNR